MKRLFPALLMCLSLQVLGEEPYFSEPVDVVDTPLQQDFKSLYRKIVRSSTGSTTEDGYQSKLLGGELIPAARFLEHDLFSMSKHPCAGITVDIFALVIPQESEEDRVVIGFDCSDPSRANGEQAAILQPIIVDDSYQYLVWFYRENRPENDIWTD